MTSECTVSVVIPVLNAESHLPELLRGLMNQKPMAPREIILVDSHSTDRTRDIATAEPGVRVIPIENFSHGRARNLGARAAQGDVVVLMTQDALPRDDAWLRNLVSPLGREKVVAVFSRQVPSPGADPMEQFYLQDSFPDGDPVIRVKTAGAPLNLADLFFSNVSAAFLRDVLLQFPFEEDLIMGEDQQFARDVLLAGYATQYQPASVVVHSHRPSSAAIFGRYFDSVCAGRQIMAGRVVQAQSWAGLRYLLREAAFVMRRRPGAFPRYACQVVARSAGTVAGRFARVLPAPLLRRFSLHSYHWKECGAPDAMPPEDRGARSTTDAEPLVGIVLLNWNGWRDSLCCLDSLQALQYRNFRIWLVDNGSTDASVARIRERYPALEIVENGGNLGFSAGNNVGIRRAMEAGCKYIWLLNTDATAAPDALGELVAAAERAPGAAATGGVIYDMDRPDKVQAWGGATVNLWVGFTRHPRHAVDPARLDYLMGACMLCRADAFRDAGLFDEGFFLIWEDADLCFRFRKAGWRLAVAPAARIRHRKSSSTGGTSAASDMHFYPSAARFFKRHAPQPALPFFAWIAAATARRWLSGRFKEAGIVLGAVPGFLRRRGSDRGRPTARW